MNGLQAMDDETLLRNLGCLVRGEKENTADIIEHLVEVDRRGLAIDKAYPSLFAYCIEVLGYSRAQAYFRIRAAHAARKHPRVLELLRSGELHLEAVVRLNPYLESPEGPALLEEAAGKSHREVEAMVARYSPEHLPQESIRMIAVRCEPPPRQPPDMPLFQAAAPAPRLETAVESRVHLSFSAPAEFLTLLERAREVTRRKFPSGRLEDVLLDALHALLDKRDPERRLLARYCPKPGNGAQEQMKLRSP